MALTLSVAATGLRDRPLTPNVHQLSEPELIQAAPIVVVGVCTNRATVNRPIQKDGLQLQLARVSLRVENVLRGKIPGSQVNYLVYGTAAGHAGPAVNMIPTVGQRVCVFLREDDGTLRSFIDVYQAMVGIHSGRHRTVPPGSLAEQVSHLLLVPGEEVSVDTYASQLPNDVHTSVQILGPLKSYRLLELIAGSSVPRVQASACREIYSAFIDSGCVDLLGGALGEATRREFEPKYMRLARQLTVNGNGWVESQATVEGKEWTRERLVIFTESKNSQIQTSACALLVSRFSERPSRCQGRSQGEARRSQGQETRGNQGKPGGNQGNQGETSGKIVESRETRDGRDVPR